MAAKHASEAEIRSGGKLKATPIRLLDYAEYQKKRLRDPFAKIFENIWKKAKK